MLPITNSACYSDQESRNSDMHLHSIQPGFGGALRDKYVWIWRCAAALMAMGIVATLAFAILFSTFVSYDDEGYFLQSYRDFLSGRVLYDQVYALYGPLTYFTAALLARFDPANVTHDAFRWIWLGIWVLIATLLAGLVWRWTGRLAVSLITLLLIGHRLSALAMDVGHPQALIIIAAIILLWLGLDWIVQPDGWRRAFWAGTVIAGIILIKINIGIFMATGVAFAVALHFKGRARVLSLGVLALAAVSFGMSIVYLTPTRGDKYFVVAYLISLAAVVFIAARRPVEHKPAARILISLFIGVGACLCLGVLLTLATGTTAQSLFAGLITIPATLVRSYHFGFVEPATRGSLALCAGAFIALGIVALLKLVNAPPAWIGLIKLMAGTGVLIAFRLNGRLPLAGSLLLLWLLVVDSSRIFGRAYANRLLLALVAIFLSLQFFPMSGSQVDWAGLMPITAAAVLVADGMDCLEQEGFPFPFPLSLRKRPVFLVRTVVAFLALGMFALEARAAIKSWSSWYRSNTLDLAGTHWVRLSPDDGALLQATVTEISRNCQNVLTLPGLYSFSLWSGVPPSETLRVNSWQFLWSDELQRAELRKVRQQSHGCVLVDREMYTFFRNIAVSPGKDRLLPEIERTMTPIFTIRNFTLYRSSLMPLSRRND